MIIGKSRYYLLIASGMYQFKVERRSGIVKNANGNLSFSVYNRYFTDETKAKTCVTKGNLKLKSNNQLYEEL